MQPNMCVWFVLLLMGAAASSQQQHSEQLPSSQTHEQQPQQRPQLQEERRQSQLEPQPQVDDVENENEPPRQPQQSQSQEEQQAVPRQDFQGDYALQAQQERSQREDGEIWTPQPEPQPQADGDLQSVTGDPPLTDVTREQQQQQQLEEEGEELSQPSGQEEDEEAPLPSDLPSLSVNQTAQLTKCCPPEEALVRRPGGGPPSCESVAPEQRWRPLLLNGRSGQRGPPDARSALISGNVSCELGRHFWLDSTAGDRFELLTTGHLYLRRSDALMEPLSFCADRLVVYLDADDDAGVPQVQVGHAARVCTVSLHEPNSVMNDDAVTPACARHMCLRKCCPRGLKLRWTDQLCIPQTGSRPWQPEFWLDDIPVSDYQTVVGNPPCNAADGSHRSVFGLEPAKYDEEKFFLRKDGRLWIPTQNGTIKLEDFCVDQVRVGHVYIGQIRTCQVIFR